MMAEVQKNMATSVESGGVSTANESLVGTSPTQERSSNSHPHDSEYDTAGSDLEGGEEYDDDDELDEEDDDDLTDEDDEDSDDVENSDSEQPTSVGVGSQEKMSESDIQKKVDEDRSNPQYIPKRGTFYEHDDRMADGEGDCVLAIGDAVSPEGNVTSGAGVNSKASAQSPSNSNSAKTMKKWQPASGVDRWSHDRFDPNEQQPKSRSELISAYGYDIRTEDAPPRARRRRRYGRGPNKYDRKWEDESAYIKASNKERKPPRASDFPALNERGPRKQRKEIREEEGRDEKENRPERRRPIVGATGSTKSSVNDRLNVAARSNHSDERREQEDLRAKLNRKTNSRQQSSGINRQAPMEFKQKNRNVKNTSSYQSKNGQGITRSEERSYDRPIQRSTQNQSNNHTVSSQSSSVNEQYQHRAQMKGTHSSSPSVSHMKQTHPMQGEVYNSNNSHANTANKIHDHSFPQHQQKTMLPQQQAGPMTQLRQPISTKPTLPPSNLSQRLQQVQNRNDPSHVGSVQMHALASQNQQQHQQQIVLGQQPNSNAMIMSAVAQQQQQQLIQAQASEQRGAPKRYSSMRRSQHDSTHLADTHTHPQQHLPPPLQIQQPPPPQQGQPAPQALIMQEQQHMLQANLLLYHQENLQAQMQALQVSQGAQAPQGKQPTYATVPTNAAQTAPPQAYGANPTNTAYYVTDAYGTASGTPQAPPPPAQYAPQQPTFLPPPQATAAALGYTNPAPPTQNTIPAGPPAGVYAGGAGPPQPAPNANPNYTNYQNYNTVGGTTYFVPPTQTTTRPVVLPQRRPTNAIPILPPAEKNKQRNNESSTSKEDPSRPSTSGATVDSGENIDHIIDNMFVQRPAFQPPQSSAQNTPLLNSENITSAIDAQKVLHSNDESNISSTNLGLTTGNAESSNTSNSISNAATSVETDLSSNTSLADNSNSNNNNTNQIATQE